MLKEILEEQNKINEFACLLQKNTGLKGCIYIHIKQGKHNPRIKYCLKTCKNNCITITINNEIIDDNKVIKNLDKKELELVKQFVSENKDLISNYWYNYNEIDTYDILQDFIKWFQEKL